jgi:hypothetical protein
LVAVAPPMGQSGSYFDNLSSIFVLPSGKVSRLQHLQFGLHDAFYGRIIIIIIIKILTITIGFQHFVLEHLIKILTITIGFQHFVLEHLIMMRPFCLLIAPPMVRSP